MAVSIRLMRLEYHSDHLLMPRLLGKSSQVIDIGGNLGAFSLDVSNSFGSTVFIVEPDPVIYSRIPVHPHVRKFNLAIADRNETVNFYVSGNSQASSFNADLARQWGIADTIKVRTTTLADFLASESIGVPDLVKIDAEGWEINILNSIPEGELRKIPQLSVEFHDHMDAGLHQPTIQGLKRMKSLGFLVIVTSKASFSHVLFLNANRLRLGVRFKFGYCLCWLAKRAYMSLPAIET